MYRKGGGQDRTQQVKIELNLHLIELVIVIIVLGISAVVVMISSGGIVARSAVAGCEANATIVESAVHEFNAEIGGTTVVTSALLTSGPSPFLKSFPSSANYKISIVAGIVMIAAPKTSKPAPFGTENACANAGP
jgi:Tfp pilus assembly protein PilE